MERLRAFLTLGSVLVALPGCAANSTSPDGTMPRSVKCDIDQKVSCGKVAVPLDRGDPSKGTLEVYYERYEQLDQDQPALEPVVFVNGGPGQSATNRRDYFLRLAGSLRDRHEVLLVDNRGTGRSGAIDCPAMQKWAEIGSGRQAARCGRALGDRAYSYGTAAATDDLEAVLDALDVEQVDMFGVSYATFFGQVFALRHPDSLRALVVDSAYPLGGSDPFARGRWGSVPAALRLGCDAFRACRRQVEHPVREVTRLVKAVARQAHKYRIVIDGRREWSNVGIGDLAEFVNEATRYPRRFGRFALAAYDRNHKSRDSLAYLLARSRSRIYPSPARVNSEGLFMSVSCADYPQAYSMTDRPGVRVNGYRAAFAAASEIGLRRRTPESPYFPFTMHEVVKYSPPTARICLRWPAREDGGSPVRAGTDYPSVPTLVLSGELDTRTPQAGAMEVASRFPESTFVSLSGVAHATISRSNGGCSRNLTRRFIEELEVGDMSCAEEVPPVGGRDGK